MSVDLIQSLLAERAGYAIRGLQGRVAEVDEQLRVLGYEPEPNASPEVRGTGRTTKARG